MDQPLCQLFHFPGVDQRETQWLVFLENRPELLMVYSAMAKIGAVNAMINTNLRLDALRHCLTSNPAKVIIVGEEVLDAFEDVKSRSGAGS